MEADSPRPRVAKLKRDAAPYQEDRVACIDLNAMLVGCNRGSLKRAAVIVSMLCLFVTGVILISGVSIILKSSRLRNKETNLMSIQDKGRSLDTDTTIRGIAFNQRIGDKLFADIKKRETSKPSSWRSDETQFTQDTQFLSYMKCPTSVRQKLLTDPYFQDRYLPEVPILMWYKHYSHEEYARIAQYGDVYGWQFANESVISSALSALNTPSNIYLFDNDRSPEQGRCTTCAVIGNGGILNGSKMGKEIDAHDYVFRVNVALTKGHEEDVGNKTSLYCAVFRSLRNSLLSGRRYGFTAPPYQKGIRYVFFPKTELAYQFVWAQIRDELNLLSPTERRSLPNFQTKLTATDLKLVHPDFERYLKFRWVNSSRKNHPVHRPSTGAIMLLLALHTCDKVDVYGFGGELGKYTNYYYDTEFKRQPIYINHDTETEIRLWKKLHQLEVINLYTRD